MPCIFGSALTMQEAVALCLKQYPLLNPDRSKNASTAFAYLKRKRKNIRSKSTQTGKSQQCCDSWCCTNSLKHMENNNTNNKSKEMGCISLPECIPSCSSQLKSFQVLGRHRFELKSLPFLVNMSACECVCVGAATRWPRRRCHSGSCCVCSGNGRCFGPRSLPLFLLPLPRQICQGRSVCGWRVGWRGEDREALIRISMYKEDNLWRNIGLSNFRMWANNI